MLLILILSSVLAVGLASLMPRYDGIFAWMLGILLAVLAGIRTGGFDYDEYLLLIDAVRTLEDADLGLRLSAAKDPLFLLAVDVAGWITDDTRLVFLLIAIVGVACKVQASTALPRRRTLFIALYAVLLAPGLEFAAIRAAMALGFVMLAFSMLWRFRQIWTALGIAGHLSMVVVAIGKLLHAHRWKTLSASLLIVPLLLPLLLSGVEDDRFGHYFDNRGTLAAFAFPLLTTFAWLAARQVALGLVQSSPLLRRDAIACTSFCITLALLLSLPSVTTSFRTLEIAWVMMLAQLVAIGPTQARRRAHPKIHFARALMAVVLVLSNLMRDTWVQIPALPA